MNRHEELRRIATAAAADPLLDDHDAQDAFNALATPANILELLHEIDNLEDEHDKQWRRAGIAAQNGLALTAEVIRQGVLLHQFAKYIIANHRQGTRDWGCKQCAPHSDMLGDGTFVCALHQALAIIKDVP